MSGKLKELYDSVQHPKPEDIKKQANDIATSIEFYIKSGEKLPIDVSVGYSTLRNTMVCAELLKVLFDDHGVVAVPVPEKLKIVVTKLV